MRSVTVFPAASALGPAGGKTGCGQDTEPCSPTSLGRDKVDAAGVAEEGAGVRGPEHGRCNLALKGLGASYRKSDNFTNTCETRPRNNVFSEGYREMFGDFRSDYSQLRWDGSRRGSVEEAGCVRACTEKKNLGPAKIPT